MSPEVEEAISDIRAAYSSTQVNVFEDGDGGAEVVVRSVPLASIYKQNETWIGFHITHTYPYADVYPHFVCANLQRTNGQPLGQGISSEGRFRNEAATQLSRRSNSHNPATDTALLKLQKVLRWLNHGQ